MSKEFQRTRQIIQNYFILDYSSLKKKRQMFLQKNLLGKSLRWHGNEDNYIKTQEDPMSSW